jgi:UDP-N-acetylmuramoyl-L-alanyl-D-glutamate--2,6-diaminopimelate ligase
VNAVPGAVTSASASPLQAIAALGDLLAAAHLPLPPDLSPDTPVNALTDDSRRVEPGALFVAIPGTRLDGRRFLCEAAVRGAVAAVTEPPFEEGLLPVVSTANARRALALMAQRFHGNPTEGLLTVGVTGTSGKTTVTHLLEGILVAAGRSTGVIGTIEGHLGERRWPAPTTTPSPLALAAIAAEMREEGAEALVMEASSHAIDQHRVDGVSFDAGIFTNLSQDHLDYHGSRESYAAAKRRFFTDVLQPSPRPRAVLNIDDPVGQEIAGVFEAPVITFGQRPGANVRVERESLTASGMRIDVTVLGEEWSLTTPLIGPGTAMNVAASAAWAQAEGFDRETIQRGLSAVRKIPGRFESIDEGQSFRVIIDYSHKPEALRGALSRCREIVGEGGRVTVVFGCGGDRDRIKRPIMGEIAGRAADQVWLTSDNPRTEDPQAIAEGVLEGLRRTTSGDEAVHVELDRRRAIQEALAAASEADVLLIAGKGHETYQEIAAERLPFDDADVARQWLRERG